MLARTMLLQPELNEKEGGRDQTSSISIHREEPKLRWISNERKQHRGKAKASRDRVRLLNRFSKRLRACNYKCWNHLIISIDSFARPTSSRASHSDLRRAPFGRGRQSDGWTVLHRASQCTCSSFIRSWSRQTFFDSKTRNRPIENILRKEAVSQDAYPEWKQEDSAQERSTTALMINLVKIEQPILNHPSRVQDETKNV